MLSDALKGLISYIFFVCVVVYSFNPFVSFNLRSVGTILWIVCFVYCCFILLWLYLKGPVNAGQLFRIGLWLIVGAAFLSIFVEDFLTGLLGFLGHKLKTGVNIESFHKTNFQLFQNFISFGIAAIGAGLSASAITSKWKNRIEAM